MSWPRRYKDARGLTASLMNAAAEVPEPTTQERAQAFWDLQRRLERPHAGHPWRWSLAFGAVGALVIALFVAARPRPTVGPAPAVVASTVAAPPPLAALPLEREIHLDRVGSLTLSDDAVVELQQATPAPAPAETGYRMRLKQGRVCAHVDHRDVPREGPVVVDAPQMRVTVIGTRFCLDTVDGKTRLFVGEGRVEVEGPSGVSVLVGAGETVASDGPELAASGPAPVAAQPPSVKTCATLPALSEREDCYAARIGGDGAEAQEALFALAALMRDERHDGRAALAQLRAYVARFPTGLFAPEAAQGILLELTAEGRPRDAVAAADDYLRRFPSGHRIGEVALLRARLLRDDLGQPAQALADYRRLLAMSLPADQREEALFSTGLCLARLGSWTEARSAFARELEEFPAGAHALEARRLVEAGP